MTDLERVQQVYDFLTGKSLPNDVHLHCRPDLPSEGAWSVIWFLQEVSRVLPDTIDQCNYCDSLYNADETNPGYIDDTDDWFWKEGGFARSDIQALADQHFCSWACMEKAIRQLYY